MKCQSCNNEIDLNDYCTCRKCKQKICPECAKRNDFVCDLCGGDVSYLS